MDKIILSILIFYLITVNAVGFVLMLIDKKKAIKRTWRIPEATLLGIAAMGGSLGALVGMQLFRHKTRHAKFFIGIPVIIIFQAGIAVAIYLLTK